MGFPQASICSGVGVLQRLQVEFYFPLDQNRLQRCSFLTMIYTTSWVNLCWGTQSTSCPSFCSALGICRAVTVTFSLLSSVAAIAVFVPLPPPFLTVLSHRCYHPSLMIQPWPVAGQPWHQQGLSPLDMGGASGSFSKKPTLWPHTIKILPHKPNTSQTFYSWSIEFGKCFSGKQNKDKMQHSTTSKKLSTPNQDIYIQFLTCSGTGLENTMKPCYYNSVKKFPRNHLQAVNFMTVGMFAVLSITLLLNY